MRATAFTTRPATEADRDAVYAIKCAASRSYVEAAYGWNESEQRALHERRFRSDETEILLVDGEPVGSVHTRRTSDAIHLLSLFVLPRWQSKGIGTAVLGRLLEAAAAQEVSVRLRVLKANPRAKALYLRTGFRVTEETATHDRMVCDDPAAIVDL